MNVPKTQTLRPIFWALAAAILLASRPATAEVLVSGSANAVVVEARGASVEEVFAALNQTFNVEFQTKVPIGRVINGTYRGTLKRVIGRVLEGQGFVIQSSANRTAVVVFGSGGAVGLSGSPSPQSASPQGVAAPAPGTPQQQVGAARPVPEGPRPNAESPEERNLPEVDYFNRGL